MSDAEIIDLTPDNIAAYGVCGYKDVNKVISHHPISNTRFENIMAMR